MQLRNVEVGKNSILRLVCIAVVATAVLSILIHWYWNQIDFDHEPATDEQVATTETDAIEDLIRMMEGEQPATVWEWLESLVFRLRLFFTAGEILFMVSVIVLFEFATSVAMILYLTRRFKR